MRVSATDDWKDVQLRGAHALERQIDRMVGVHMRKIGSREYISEMLIFISAGDGALKHRETNHADYAVSV